MLKYKHSLFIIIQWLNNFESLFFLFILCDVKYHVNAKVTSRLYVSTPYTKEQHKRNTKHVEITNVYFLNDLLFLNFISFLIFCFFF